MGCDPLIQDLAVEEAEVTVEEGEDTVKEAEVMVGEAMVEAEGVTVGVEVRFLLRWGTLYT